MARQQKKVREVNESKSSDETSPKDEAAVQSPLDLAVPVSETVQIRAIALSDSLIQTDRAIFVKKSRYRVKIEIVGAEHQLDVEACTLDVIASFSLVALQGEGSDEVPVLTIKASFLLEYNLPESVSFESQQLQAFASTNGIYNAWPYWREYVQSTIARMGLPPIVVPVFRLT